MGYAAIGSCFSTVTQAAVHVCGSSFPYLSATGATFSCTGLTSSAGNSATLSMSQCTTSCTTAARVVSFPECEPLTWVPGPEPWNLSVSDAATVFGAIASVWILGAVTRWWRRALGDHNRDYDD
jgi:hypothetical protein